ncbi:MAG: hypothetical protein ACOC1I_03610 [Spirochaetota bacterium]
MKNRLMTAAALLLVASAAFAGPQFRLAGHAYTPLEQLPRTESGWDAVIVPGGSTLSGWHWEVVLDRLGFGMHYAMDFRATELANDPFVVDWKGDFFLSYHFFGGGAVLDPFVEIGWGNAGRASVPSVEEAGYPDWEERVADGSATALALYSYGAAGLALDLNGLLLGARLAWMPGELVSPIPDPRVSLQTVPEFEIGIFAGIALGSHNRRPDRQHRRW